MLVLTTWFLFLKKNQAKKKTLLKCETFPIECETIKKCCFFITFGSA